MSIYQLALLIALVIAANLVLLIALRVTRQERRRITGSGATDALPRAAGGVAPGSAQESPAPSPESLLSAAGLSHELYQRMTRIVSFVFIGSAMTIATLTGSPDATEIIVLLAVGLILIELFQDVLPASFLGRLRLPVEATVVLALLTILIYLTGGLESPYFFGYILVVGGAALSVSELAAAILAMISSAAYLAAVVLAANGLPLAAADVGLVAFNLVSIALVMYVGSVIGSTQRRAREAALSLSRFDALTGLLATKYFVAELEQEIRRATRSRRPFAFILADLDGLKRINEEFGLEGGDLAIKATADAIRGAVRATDVVGRNSGAADEFFVMLPDTDLAGAEVVAETIRTEVARSAVARSTRTMHWTASLGVLSFPDDARTWEELKNRANLAEQQAKRRGGDTVVRYRDLALPAGSSHVERRPRGRSDDPPPQSSGPAPWETR